MKINEILNPTGDIPGIGKVAQSLLSKLGVFNVGQLLQYYPRDYEDRTKIRGFGLWQQGKINTIALVTAHTWIGGAHKRTLKIQVQDLTGTAYLVAFNRSFLQNIFPVGCVCYITGAFSVSYSQVQSTSFEAKKILDSGLLSSLANIAPPEQGIFPIYRLTAGLSLKNLQKYIKTALNIYAKTVSTTLPQELIKKHNLQQKSTAIEQVHFPVSFESLKQARHTLIYEEFFDFEMIITKRLLEHKGIQFLKNNINKDIISQITQDKTQSLAQGLESDNLTSKKDFENNFIQGLCPLQKKLLLSLPFSLTQDQKIAVIDINLDIDRGFKERNEIEQGKSPQHKPWTMARLCQADVGAGKTLVAFFAVLRVINWGTQAALMAPTELLALQHATTADKLLSPLGVKVAFLSGNTKAQGRKTLLKAVSQGEVQFLVGTHALFSRDVIYKDLQLAVIDEQHKFGVLQREQILNKGKSKNFLPHLLMMSATPIPQTLALTVFGDLDITQIKTMPQGRKTIQTYLSVMGHEKNVYDAVKKELLKGHQAYFVYPRIQDSEENDIKSAQESFEVLSKKMLKGFSCALLHSKVPQDVQEQTINDFSKGKINVLVATSVVEVGVDVPNATCMVIEHADRFGLSQLHQLRGRVGRNALQSYCFLIYSKNITQIGIQRLKVMRQSTDGFFIAEEDLKLRGPGEILGKVQSGDMQLGLADFVRDASILQEARKDALDMCISGCV